MPVIILLPLLFFMFRKQKKEVAERGKLSKGDRVVTQAGLIGDIVEKGERISKLKIAPGTVVQVLTTSLAPLEANGAAQRDSKEAASKDLDDLKTAKAAAGAKK